MKAILGALLIVIGIAVFVVKGISYTTTEEVADIGPIEVTKESEKTIPLSPGLGGIALLGGVALTEGGAPRPPLDGETRRSVMLGWTITLFLVALVAAVLGFGGIAGASAGNAKTLFFVFLVVFVLSLVASAARRT